MDFLQSSQERFLEEKEDVPFVPFLFHLYLFPVWNPYHVFDRTGAPLPFLNRCPTCLMAALVGRCATQEVRLFSQLSLETEWDKDSSHPGRLGPLSESQRFDGGRKECYGQEEVSEFKGGNMCVGSSKWWGLGGRTSSNGEWVEIREEIWKRATGQDWCPLRREGEEVRGRF